MNIEIREFKVNHLYMLKEMLESNNYEYMHQVKMKALPKIGYIAMMGSHPIAAGFLRKVEGGFAQLDTLTSNSQFGSRIRHEGIKLVVDELISSAKQLKVLGILAFTKDEGILSRAKSIGFEVVPQTLITLPLT